MLVFTFPTPPTKSGTFDTILKNLPWNKVDKTQAFILCVGAIGFSSTFIYEWAVGGAGYLFPTTFGWFLVTATIKIGADFARKRDIK